MRLRITMPEGDNFNTGWAANVFLNDVDVSKWTTNVVVRVPADGVVTARVEFALTGLDLDVPAHIRDALSVGEPVEVGAADK